MSTVCSITTITSVNTTLGADRLMLVNRVHIHRSWCWSMHQCIPTGLTILVMLGKEFPAYEISSLPFGMSFSSGGVRHCSGLNRFKTLDVKSSDVTTDTIFNVYYCNILKWNAFKNPPICGYGVLDFHTELLKNDISYCLSTSTLGA